MAECPFCRTEVHNEATICKSCGAEKVDTFWGNFNHNFKKNQHAAIRVLAIPGLLVGALVGVSVGTNSTAFIGGIAFVFGFAATVALPSLLRTLIFERNKTYWYR
ncbi:hypothetical protein [Providencia rettgeri]|uniref:hypothetical protein n=1 Tax=Providencia rettgeri TaxID=587 RepID=UPI002551FB76|nr:hypothetical protein [Providencia rettgeri]MDK7747183.1 hypothetical protein [Providencia rettgeri]MDK7760029.1 hypothetical protein [Providencia rettgeri]HEM7146954.1 hypothetical protein [Providencia stuartii]